MRILAVLGIGIPVVLVVLVLTVSLALVSCCYSTGYMKAYSTLCEDYTTAQAIYEGRLTPRKAKGCRTLWEDTIVYKRHNDKVCLLTSAGGAESCWWMAQPDEYVERPCRSF